MADLSELIERVEKLTGPDREVDRDVLRVAGTHILEKRGKDRKAWWYPVDGSVAKYSNEGGFGYPPPFPHFTASLDAAVALVERVLPGWKWAVSTDYDRHHLEYPCHAHVMERILPHPDADYNDFADGHGPTPAIALVRALLRALQAQEGRDG